MKKDGQQITIVTAPISIPKKEMFDCAIRDHVLSDHICKFRKELEKKGIEVFARKENILATSEGYFAAMYMDDIRNKPGGIDNPIPFKGKDGRLKIDIVTEKGEMVIADLADLVAMRFAPNPKKYKRTYFYDANPENCNGANLFWCSGIKYLVLKTFKIKTKSTRALGSITQN